MGNFGPLEIGIIALIVLVIFGPKRLPELGRSLGRGMREFKDSITGKDDSSAGVAELEQPEERRGQPEARAGQEARPDGAPSAAERDETPASAGEPRT